MPLLRSRTNSATAIAAAALSLLIAAAPHRLSRADSIVNFWLSNGNTGPVVPVIYAFPGSVGQLQVRARPAAGYRLAAFSLDLVAQQPGVLSFEDVEVLNPLLEARPPLYRHQITFDTEAGLDVQPDLIDSFLGASLFEIAMDLSNGAGIGPVCGDDPHCSAETGEPSWQVATVTYQTGMSLAATELFLQIGEQGVWQSPADATEPDPPTDTSAVFGLPNDAVNHWSVPSAGGVDHRHNHQGLADAVIQVATADFDQDGDVDGGDLIVWQRGVATGSSLAEGDADGDSEVDAADLAAWRFQFGAAGAALLPGLPAPEPTGLAAAITLATVLASRRRGGGG